jgi:predicted nuclease with TOPRIM domain
VKLLRISLIIAIVAGLAAGALTFTKVKDIIDTTRAERNDWHTKDDAEVLAHTKTKKTLKDTSDKLTATQKNLEQTKGELAAANSKVDDLTKNNADLTDKLAKSTASLDDAQQQLERWRILHLTPDQVQGVITNLAQTQKDKEALIAKNLKLQKEVTDWNDRWNNFFQGDQDVPLPTGLRGKIVAVDPKYNFVVLNIGEEQGAKAHGVMLVGKDGMLLGKVRITTVTKNECVANILPNWTRGEIMEGDEVLIY